MVPSIASLKRTLFYWDVIDDHGEPVSCGIAAFGDNDTAYIGRFFNTRSQDLTEIQIETALEEIPDRDIYPELANEDVKVATEHLEVDTFIKRPTLQDYYFFRGDDGRGLPQLRAMLLDETRALEIISRNPHPHIVPYHGCRVRRGRITGIVLEKLSGYSLWSLLEDNRGVVDLIPFMGALHSAVEHLHRLGLSHNDICPHNVMVVSGNPVLIDFGSCRKTGERMAASGGSPGWKEDNDDYTTSKESHDIIGLEKLRQWVLKKSSGTKDLRC